LKLPFTPRRETAARLSGCAVRALLALLLAGAGFFGGYAPLTVGMVGAAGPGWEGFAALTGAIAGGMLFLDFTHAMRTAACAVLLFTSNNAFCGLRAYRKPYFLPALTAGLSLSVDAAYAIRSGSAGEAAFCVLSALLAALFASCARVALTEGNARREHPAASLAVLLGVLSALAVPELPGGFAPGRAAAVLAALLLSFGRETDGALASALCVGLAADLAAPGSAFLHTASCGFGALLTKLPRRESRLRAAGAFALSTALFALPADARTGAALLCEGLAGTLAFLLIPAHLLRRLRAADETERAPEDDLRRRLREAAAALRELYDGVTRAEPPPEENPAVIYDRAAEAVCRDCAQRERCWLNEYNRTYTALSDATGALLRNGQGRGEDFPPYFADRCVRFSGFLSAVNAEARAFLLRRQYRARLTAARTQAAAQYARLSELLTQTAERDAAAEAGAAPRLPYRVGLASQPREGRRVSGDSAVSFETAMGELCLLLSDGMGSGEEARCDSALAVRLIERFLRAGVDADSALRTINSALNLRAETSDSFATVDLLTLSLRNGEGALYKYGAAPTYLKRGGRVRRVSCASLPAGLAEEALPPETTHIRLERGSFLVMVTDGVADAADDEWLRALLAAWEGENPQLLASAILADSRERWGAGDDAGVLALYLPEDGGATEV